MYYMIGQLNLNLLYGGSGAVSAVLGFGQVA